MPDFVPRREAELVTWSANFDQKIHADPEAFFLSAAQADDYRAAHQSFAELHQLSNQNGTRTPAGLAAKDAARERLLEVARLLAGIVRSRPEVSNAQRLLLGLRPRREVGPRIAAPQSAPAIDILLVRGRTLRVRLHDSASPMRLAKPKGVAGAVIFYAIADEPPTERSGWRVSAHVTRTLLDVTIREQVPPGTRVWLCARWMSPRCENGPVGLAVGEWLGGGVARAA